MICEHNGSVRRCDVRSDNDERQPRLCAAAVRDTRRTHSADGHLKRALEREVCKYRLFASTANPINSIPFFLGHGLPREKPRGGGGPAPHQGRSALAASQWVLCSVKCNRCMVAAGYADAHYLWCCSEGQSPMHAHANKMRTSGHGPVSSASLVRTRRLAGRVEHRELVIPSGVVPTGCQ